MECCAHLLSNSLRNSQPHTCGTSLSLVSVSHERLNRFRRLLPSSTACTNHPGRCCVSTEQTGGVVAGMCIACSAADATCVYANTLLTDLFTAGASSFFCCFAGGSVACLAGLATGAGSVELCCFLPPLKKDDISLCFIVTKHASLKLLS